MTAGKGKRQVATVGRNAEIVYNAHAVSDISLARLGGLGLRWNANLQDGR